MEASNTFGPYINQLRFDGNKWYKVDGKGFNPETKGTSTLVEFVKTFKVGDMMIFTSSHNMYTAFAGKWWTSNNWIDIKNDFGVTLFPTNEASEHISFIAIKGYGVLFEEKSRSVKKYFTITDPVIHCPKKISVKLSNDHLNWNKLDFEDLYNGTDDNTIRKEYPTDDLYSNNVDGNKNKMSSKKNEKI